jgi:hypothetical protein
LLSPDAPDDVASAASVKITGPSIERACAMARSSAISLPCMRKRSGQNSCASRVASRSAAAASPSVMTSTWEQSSGTSVNGLPIMMPAASAMPSASRRRHSRSMSP